MTTNADSNQPKGWKPLTSSRKLLGPLAALTVIVIAIVATSTHQYGAQGTISKVTGRKIITEITIQFLPILFAVFCGIVWGWIDLDVKRLTPWFELSKANGSIGKYSLLTQYPVDFPFSVPVRSARRKQWNLFCASIAAIAVYWGFTPLLGSLYAIRPVNIPETVQIFMAKDAVNVSPNSTQGPLFLYSAFATLFFSQRLPAFTTADSVISPVQVISEPVDLGVNSSVTYQATRYTSDLECWPAASVKIGRGQLISFDDGRGCNATDLFFTPDPDQYPNENFIGYYIGWYRDPRSEYTLSDAGCPNTTSHRFLAVWMSLHNGSYNFDNDPNSIALFCEPKYMQQQVEATISLVDLKPVKYVPLESLQPLNEKSFNSTAFEYTIGTSYTPNSRLDTARPEVPYQNTGIANIRLTSILRKLQVGRAEANMNTMVPFAIGATQFPLEAYLNATNLSEAYRKAHQLMFTLLMQNELISGEYQETASTATYTSINDAVVIVPAIAGVLIAVSSIILIITLLLMSKYRIAETCFTSDPDSITALLRNVNNYGVVSMIKENFGQQKKHQFEGIESSRFRLTTDQGRQKIELLDHSPQHISHSSSFKEENYDEKPLPVPPRTKSHDRKKYILCLFAAILSGVLITISVLKLRSDANNGLALGGMSPFAERIVLNYIPTLMATLCEPVWIEIARLACIYLPYHQLASQLVPAKSSLDLTFAGRPPQFNIFKAARSGHYLISVLGITILFANVLTIAMNGLFNVESIQVTSPLTSHARYNARFNEQALARKANFSTNTGSVGDDVDASFALYMALSTYSNEMTMPTDLGKQQYLIPQNVSLNDLPTSTFTYTTTGLGAYLDCEELSMTPSKAFYTFSFGPTLSTADLSVDFTLEDATKYNCITASLGLLEAEGQQSFAGDPSGNNAVEMALQLRAPEGTNDTQYVEFCESRILFGWVRSTAVLSGTSDYHNYTSSYETRNSVNAVSANFTATMMSCRPQTYSAPYNVSISGDGRLLSAIQAGPKETNPSLLATLEVTTQSLSSVIGRPAAVYPLYHNDTVSSDWFHYYIKVLTNSASMLDPTLPPPNAADAAPLLSEVYARAWATFMYTQAEYLEEVSGPEAIASNTVIVQRTDMVNRVFVRGFMFWIAAAVLVENIVVCVVLVVKMPRPFLDNTPVSIASVLAHFSKSHCLEDFFDPPPPVASAQTGAAGLENHDSTVTRSGRAASSCYSSSSQGLGSIEKSEPLYAFGHFIGTDGQPRVGINRYPHVTPLNLRERRSWKLGIFGSRDDDFVLR